MCVLMCVIICSIDTVAHVVVLCLLK